TRRERDAIQSLDAGTDPARRLVARHAVRPVGTEPGNHAAGGRHRLSRRFSPDDVGDDPCDPADTAAEAARWRHGTGRRGGGLTTPGGAWWSGPACDRMTA